MTKTNETPVTETETETVVEQNKIQALLVSNKGQRGKMIGTESELADLFTEHKCTTATDMIMTLHDLGHPNNDIAYTLREFGIVTKKSAYPMVRNTIDRVMASRARAKKTA